MSLANQAGPGIPDVGGSLPSAEQAGRTLVQPPDVVAAGEGVLSWVGSALYSLGEAVLTGLGNALGSMDFDLS